MSRNPAKNVSAIALFGNPIWKAVCAKPMPNNELDALALENQSALVEMVSGRGLPGHAKTLEHHARIALLLAKKGFGPERIESIQVAIDLLKVHCEDRDTSSASIQLSAEEKQCLIDLLDTMKQQNAAATRSEFVQTVLEHQRAVMPRSRALRRNHAD